MSKVITSQHFAPSLINWLAQRCPGFEEVEGPIHTIAFVDPRPDNVAREEDVLTVCALSRWTPHTCEATLATSGAKRAWRAAILEAAGVDTGPLRSLDAVDAALAALTALIVAEGKDWFALGGSAEGVLTRSQAP